MPTPRLLRPRSPLFVVSALLTLGAIGALPGLTPPAHAGGSIPSCTSPTLAMCEDPAYISGACGQIQLGVCGDMNAADYRSKYYAASGDGKLEFLPKRAPVSSNLHDGRWSIYDPSRLVVIANADPSYGGDQVRSLLPASNAVSSPLINIGPIAGPFEGDGTEVTSCREYVFKRYWDYTKFQRAIGACGRDSDCVYDAAMTGPFAIANKVLRERNGVAPLDQQVPLFVGRKSKNIFFDTLVTTWSKDPAKLARYNEILARQNANANYYRIATGEHFIPMGHGGEIFADEWAFHRSLHDRTASTSDAQWQEYASRRTKFAELRAINDNLISCAAHGNSFCTWGNSFYADMRRANDEAMFQMASDEWDLGNDGCLSTSNFTCDWSPDDFRAEFTHLFGKEMQAAYADCTPLVGSARFLATDVPNDPWVNIDGVWYQRPSSDVPAFKAWSDAQKAHLLAQFAALPKYPEIDEAKKRLPGHVGSAMSGNNAIGDPSLFQAGYDYSIDWDVRKVLQKSDADTQACAYAGSFNANFHADATLLGSNVASLMGLRPSRDGFKHIASSETSVFADARRAGGAPKVSSHTTILDQDVYTPVTDQYIANWTAPLEQQSKDTTHISQTFVIVVVPVTFEAYGQLSYGATASLTSAATIDCAAAPKFGLNFATTPYVHADAVGTIAVGVPGFEIGVKGEVALVHIDMPITGGVNVDENNPVEHKPVLRFTTRGDVELRELSGQVSLFAEALFLTYEKELFQWNGLHQSLNLWKTGADVELAAYKLIKACPITNPNCDGGMSP